MLHDVKSTDKPPNRTCGASGALGPANHRLRSLGCGSVDCLIGPLGVWGKP